MGKQEALYEKVQELLKKSPDKPVSQVLKEAKISSSLYYSARRKFMKPAPAKTKTAKVKYRKIKADTSAPPAAKSGERMVMLMGTADQIRDFMGGSL